MDNSILHTEGNACGIITTPVIECTFENEYIHVSHDMSKKEIYGYLISKSIDLEATTHNIA